ncbi:MAG TPA: tetratricopeptide repeat protein [Pirellulales bacterium]|nr:tetratricopeptide repeat protein [Pirellulales bacterium]
MVARARRPLIALAAGLLAACSGLSLDQSEAAPPSSGSTVFPWFKRGSSNSATTTPVVAPAAKPNDDDDGPIDKLSAGLSSMGKSVKKTFTRSSPKTTTTHPQPKTEVDALSLTKPAKPSADFYISLAHFKEREGNQAGAIEQYQKALEVEPNNLTAL